jgi:predicted  nucleic acid-binding Zn-ribbon protein
MSDEPLTQEPRKDRARDVLNFFAVGIIAFGGGILVESQLAAKTAASVNLAHDQEVQQLQQTLQQAAARTEQEKQALKDSLAKEREEHAKDIQSKDRHLASVSSNAAGMRRDLEAGLSAARSSGAACTARITGISEALGGIFDSIGEVTGIAQDLGRENQQLKADNKSLTDKLVGWQKWNTENMQRITINGKRAS